MACVLREQPVSFVEIYKKVRKFDKRLADGFGPRDCIHRISRYCQHLGMKKQDARNWQSSVKSVWFTHESLWSLLWSKKATQTENNRFKTWLYVWRSPDLETENPIDLVCISKKFRRSLQYTRVTALLKDKTKQK